MLYNSLSGFNLQYEILESEVPEQESTIETFRQINNTEIIIATPEGYMPNYELITAMSGVGTIGTKIDSQKAINKPVLRTMKEILEALK